MKNKKSGAKLVSMNRVFIFLFFILIIGVYFFANYLVFETLISAFFVKSIKFKIIVAVFVLLSAISFFVYEFTLRFFKLSFLQYYSYLWMGFVSISFIFFLTIYFLRLLKLPYLQLISIFALDLTLFLSIIAVKNGLKLPEVKKVRIRYKELPKKLDGYKIVHISDIHLGSIKTKNWTEKFVSIVNSLEPDLILITGDLIDRGVKHMKEGFFYLSHLKAKEGIYAVTGNHEFYSNYKLFLNLIEKTGIKRVENKCLKINNDLEIVGMDDPELREFLKKKITFDNIIKTCSTDSFKIFIYHRPEKFEDVVEKGVNLQLSGHTHRGQIFPLNIIVSFVYKYSYGLYKKGNSFIYTTSGVSTWGPPMRLFSKNEIPLVILSKE